MKEEIIASDAPESIGCYSQAVKSHGVVYLSGQIPLDPDTMTIVEGGIESQVKQVFENLVEVAKSSNGHLNNILKLTVFLTDIAYIQCVNEIMPAFFEKPYPARTSIQVAALPRGALIEVDAIMSSI